jgi:hypothetical protein
MAAAEGGPTVAGPGARGGRDDARRTVVTGDAIAQPRPGRAPGDGSQLLSDIQRAAEIYRYVSVLPGNPMSRIGDFLPDRPAVDPGSPGAIRSHFAKPFNRVLTQFALGIFGLLSGPLAAPLRPGRAVPGTRATRRAAQQHMGGRLG